jgi:hypothetical protein
VALFKFDEVATPGKPVISDFLHWLGAGFEPTVHGFGTVKAVGVASQSEFVKGRKGPNSARFQFVLGGRRGSVPPRPAARRAASIGPYNSCEYGACSCAAQRPALTEGHASTASRLRAALPVGIICAPGSADTAHILSLTVLSNVVFLIC